MVKICARDVKKCAKAWIQDTKKPDLPKEAGFFKVLRCDRLSGGHFSNRLGNTGDDRVWIGL